MTNANLAGANLTRAEFTLLKSLTNANLTGAEISGASFAETTSKGFTQAQLQSAANYQAKNLSDIVLSGNDLTGWDFNGQNLVGADFSYSSLTNVNLAGADLRGAIGWREEGRLGNTIEPDGVLWRLVVDGRLLLRDDDGVPEPAPSEWLTPRAPIPMTIQRQMLVTDNGVLQLMLDDDVWGSTISFQPGIPVQLGGTLELTFSDEAQMATWVYS